MRKLLFFILSLSLPTLADQVAEIDFTLHSSDNVVNGSSESVFTYALGSTNINGLIGIKECDTSGNDSWCNKHTSSPLPTSQPTWFYKRVCESSGYCVKIASAVSTPNGILYTPYKSSYELEGYTAQADGSYIIPSRDYHMSVKLESVLPVGEFDFPSIRVDKLMVCKATPNYGDAYCDAGVGTIATVNIYADIHITVPQSCTVNSGQTVNVELPGASGSAFVKGGAGHPPAGFSEKQVSVPIKCLGGGAGTVTMTAHGVNATNYPGSLATSNPDVGVLLVDRTAGSGTITQVIKPNDETTGSTIRLSEDGSGAATLGILPIWLGNSQPAAGNYTAQSYLRLDYQ